MIVEGPLNLGLVDIAFDSKGIDDVDTSDHEYPIVGSLDLARRLADESSLARRYLTRFQRAS